MSQEKEEQNLDQAMIQTEEKEQVKTENPEKLPQIDKKVEQKESQKEKSHTKSSSAKILEENFAKISPHKYQNKSIFNEYITEHSILKELEKIGDRNQLLRYYTPQKDEKSSYLFDSKVKTRGTNFAYSPPKFSNDTKYHVTSTGHQQGQYEELEKIGIRGTNSQVVRFLVQKCKWLETQLFDMQKQFNNHKNWYYEVKSQEKVIMNDLKSNQKNLEKQLNYDQKDIKDLKNFTLKLEKYSKTKFHSIDDNQRILYEKIQKQKKEYDDNLRSFNEKFAQLIHNSGSETKKLQNKYEELNVFNKQQQAIQQAKLPPVKFAQSEYQSNYNKMPKPQHMEDYSVFENYINVIVADALQKQQLQQKQEMILNLSHSDKLNRAQYMDDVAFSADSHGFNKVMRMDNIFNKNHLKA